jgi:hypothetical protein
MAWTNTLAYFVLKAVTKIKSFITLMPDQAQSGEGTLSAPSLFIILVGTSSTLISKSF